MGRLVIVVPLRAGAYDDALALLRRGPPWDVDADGLERYWAFLSEHEAVLLLDGPGVGDSHGALSGGLSTWRSGSDWERCASSPPRVARSVQSWARPPDLDGVFFGPLPGPGDSEGGDALAGPR